MLLRFAVSVQLLVLALQQTTQLVTAQGLKRSVSLKEHQQYRDFVPLSAKNLTEIAMQDEQAWVIHVHDGFLDPDVKRLAGQVRGLIRFGLVSVADSEAIDLMKFDPSRHFFRSLPFGWESRKRGKFLDTEGFAAALAHADDSVPGDLLTPVHTEQETKAVLAEAIMSKPSRFTVLFTVEGDKPSLLHRVLSRKLIRNFNFALLPRADKAALKAAGLGRLTIAVPGMSVLTVTNTGAVRSSRMSDSGSLQFADALRFLVEFNRQFRPDLPGDSQTSDRKVLYMSDILDAERLIFQVEDAAASQADADGDRKTGQPASPAGTIGEDLNEEL